MLNITEVRVKLMRHRTDRLRAFCSITIDDDFVVHDLRVIEGRKGLFVAMPSRKLTDNCPNCGGKNELRAKYCNECGEALDEHRAESAEGRDKYHVDVAHPINTPCRELVQDTVLAAYEEEKGRVEAGMEPLHEYTGEELDELAEEYEEEDYEEEEEEEEAQEAYEPQTEEEPRPEEAAEPEPAPEDIEKERVEAEEAEQEAPAEEAGPVSYGDLGFVEAEEASPEPWAEAEQEEPAEEYEEEEEAPEQGQREQPAEEYEETPEQYEEEEEEEQEEGEQEELEGPGQTGRRARRQRERKKGGFGDGIL